LESFGVRRSFWASSVQQIALGELTAPLYTFRNKRNARGNYAQKAIGRERRRFKAGVVSAPAEGESSQPLIKEFVYFKLRDTRVPLPLGWMLSAAAARTIREQINQDEEGRSKPERLERGTQDSSAAPVITFLSG
jgi:hypothetical protein